MIQYASGNPPVNIPLTFDTYYVIVDILNHYHDHASVLSIQKIIKDFRLNFPMQQRRRSASLNTKKAAGIGDISSKLIKMAEQITKKPLTEIINISIGIDTFPELTKVGKLSPIYKHPKNGSRFKHLYKTYLSTAQNSILKYVNLT